MGAIKNFYHDEICNGMNLDHLDEEYFISKTEEMMIIDRANEIQEDCDRAGLPKWMHN